MDGGHRCLGSPGRPKRACEFYPEVRPRAISANGRQFVGRDFTSLPRLAGFTRATTSPYYPQSNGKIERFHRSFKADYLYPACPLTLEDARRAIAAYVAYYKSVRL